MCTLMWASPLACLYLMAIILFNFLPIVVLKFEMLFCIQVVRFLGHFEKSTQVYFLKFICVKIIVTISLNTASEMMMSFELDASPSESPSKMISVIAH